MCKDFAGKCDIMRHLHQPKVGRSHLEACLDWPGADLQSIRGSQRCKGVCLSSMPGKGCAAAIHQGGQLQVTDDQQTRAGIIRVDSSPGRSSFAEEFGAEGTWHIGWSNYNFVPADAHKRNRPLQNQKPFNTTSSDQSVLHQRKPRRG